MSGSGLGAGARSTCPPQLTQAPRTSLETHARMIDQASLSSETKASSFPTGNGSKEKNPSRLYARKPPREHRVRSALGDILHTHDKARGASRLVHEALAHRLCTRDGFGLCPAEGCDPGPGRPMARPCRKRRVASLATRKPPLVLLAASPQKDSARTVPMPWITGIVQTANPRPSRDSSLRACF